MMIPHQTQPTNPKNFKCMADLCQVLEVYDLLTDEGYTLSLAEIDAFVIKGGVKHKLTPFELAKMLELEVRIEAGSITPEGIQAFVIDVFGEKTYVSECYWTFTSQLDHQTLTNFICENAGSGVYELLETL